MKLMVLLHIWNGETGYWKLDLKNEKFIRTWS